MKQSSKQFFVGLMSGTSADGIDAVVAEISGQGRGMRARLLAHTEEKFSAAFRKRILRGCLHGHVAEICELNFELGEHFARATLNAIRKAKLKPSQITAIGSHGQTIHYLPDAKFPSTLQIGEPSVIAERTGITTVADFRVRDMAAGGLGAPLAPFADWALFTHATKPRIVQNIGGIGNLAFLPPRARLADVRGFDTGPGNMIIDAVVTELTGGKMTFDHNGGWAATGRISQQLLNFCMQHPYIRRKPPKTTGREEFGEMFVREFLARGRKLRLREEDLVTTATAFTAASIADAYRRFVFPKLNQTEQDKLQIVVNGGGAKNETLLVMLAERTWCDILTLEDFGISSSAKEPLAFAIMAHETLQGRPSNVPSVTGARRAVVLGKIIPGGF